jgi:hypothetical protein
MFSVIYHERTVIPRFNSARRLFQYFAAAFLLFALDLPALLCVNDFIPVLGAGYIR